MKILYLVPHVPNATKIRSHFHVQGLVQAGHDVTVATLERSPQDTKNISRLREQGIKVISARLSRLQMIRNALLALPGRLPLQATILWSDSLMESISRHLQTDAPDIIHVEHLRMARYGLPLVKDWPVLWDAVDYLTVLYEQAARSSSSLAQRLISRLEAPRLPAYEHRLTEQFPATIVISNNDLVLFQKNNPVADRIFLSLTGVPVTTPPPEMQNRAPSRLIITGTLNYHPNVASVEYFVKDILPLIRQQQPDIHLQLVGAHPAASIKALETDQIEVTGFVDSITDYLERATLALAPVVYGSGMQIKVLEAFLTGTPLVATSVALRGLNVQHEQEVLVGDTPADFAAAVLRLLSDPDLRARIGAAGRKYIEDNHDLRVTTAHLETLYHRVMSGQSNGS
jgi:polysaccharide biosynthesis protein PslH